MASADSLGFMRVSLKVGKGIVGLSCGYSKRRGAGCFWAFKQPLGTLEPMRKIEEAAWDYADTCNISIAYDGVGYDMIRTFRHDNGCDNAFYIAEIMDKSTVTFMGNPDRTPRTNYVSTSVEELRFVKINNPQGVHPDLMSRLKNWGVLLDVHQPAVLKLGEGAGYTLCNASSGAVAAVLRNAH